MSQPQPKLASSTLEPDSRKWEWLMAIYDALALVAVLTTMIGAFAALTPRFFTAPTFLAIANTNTEILVVATGMTLVLMLGEIDLSIGSVLGLCNCVLGVAMMWWNLPGWLAVLLCLATGTLCGLINGLITVTWRVPSFIVTLGMFEAARGAAYQLTNSRDVFIGNPILEFGSIRVSDLTGTWIASLWGHILPKAWANIVNDLTLLFLIAIALVIVAQVVLSRTVLGRYIKAIGNNETAVALSGIDPRPVKVTVFALSGLCAGLGAWMQVARFGSSNPNYGLGLELSAIAAVVIGGTSLLGGRGSAGRTLLGVMIIAVLHAGLAQLGAKEPAKRIVTGTLIVLAVVLDYYRQRLHKKGASV